MGFIIVYAVLILLIAVLIVVVRQEHSRAKAVAAMSPEDRSRYELQRKEERRALHATLLTRQHGQINPKMICPHCQYTNCVRLQTVKRKKGISGSKATAAILTGGVSLLATGLARKEQMTEAYCGNCNNNWLF